MENINNTIKNTLILPCCEMLKNKGIQDRNFEKPKYPTAIFYLGKNSEFYYEEMSNDLIAGWGDSATYIKHYIVNDSVKSLDTLLDFDGNHITVEDLKKDITKMMSNSVVFSDMNYINIYCILETSYLTVDQFKGWYLFIENLKSVIPVALRTCLMLILNQSLDNMENSQKVRECLLSLYKSEEYGSPDSHLYDSVFLFSNRLRNGSYIELNSNSQDYLDYNLFADIILLSNTNNSETMSRMEKIYNKKIPALSAAYSNLSKPISDITMITLKRALNRIKNEISKISDENTVEYNIISKILGITNGNVPFIEEFYRNHIENKTTDLIALEYLPSKKSCLNMKYEEANEETQGCLDYFVKKNYFEIPKKMIEENKSNLIKQIKGKITAYMTLQQQKSLQFFKGDVELTVKELLNSSTNVEYKNADVKNAITLMVKRNTIEQFIPIIVAAVKELIEASKNSVNLFGEIYHNINSMTAGENKGLRVNLQSYYEDIVDMYYIDRSRIDAVTKNILVNCLSISDMLEILKKEMENIFASNPVFSMSFVDELIARVAIYGESVDIGNLITQELINNLDNKLALHSYNTFSERYFEAYFLNTSQEVENNSLVQALEQRAKGLSVPVTFYNTLSDEMIESIWFYRCSEDNVRI